MLYQRSIFLTLACLLLGFSAFAQPTGARDEAVYAEIKGHVFKPAKKEATPERINMLKRPDGFEARIFATDLKGPRMMYTDDKGNVYVTQPSEGNVIMLTDSDNDGLADQQKTVAELDKVHGLAVLEDTMYMITVTEVYKAAIKEDGTLGEPEMILEDLPDGGQHANRTIFAGPDGKLYITVGSTCNACDEPNPENAALLQVNSDGTARRIYASGLRNTIGIDWHPETGQLFGMDHGIDWLGDEEQKEELNMIEDGAQYGWPYIYADGGHNPADQPKEGYEAYAAKSKEPVLLFDAHSAPMNFLFYDMEQFPEEYHNDAFVTLHGSWNRKEPSGYKVVRVHFEDGQPVKYEDFISGFLIEDEKAHFGRVCGMALMPDGSLLVGDDALGNIYRITYSGD